MGTSFTPQLKKILSQHGCRLVRPGKGDHEIWYSPINESDLWSMAWSNLVTLPMLSSSRPACPSSS